MKRKIIFSGCSFTWGQSLWAYEDIPNIPNAHQWTALNHEISEDIQETRKKYRFPEIVCNKLGNYEPIVKLLNGGTDEESVRFVDLVVDCNPEMLQHTNLTNQVYELDEIDAVVFQTTQAYRSSYPFTYKGENYNLFSTPDMKNFSKVEKYIVNKNEIGDIISDESIEIENGIDLFIEYLISKNIKVEDFENEHKKLLADSIENLLKKWYDRGKKVFLLCWTDEYLEEINKRPFLKSIFVPLQYDNRTFTHIHELFYYNEEMKIDKHIKNRDMGSDEHPSSICHEVIADSIIKKWENKLI